MCIIAVCATRRLMEEELKGSFFSNSDGCGISWSKDEKNHYVKGLMTYPELEKVYATVEQLPHVVHFRTSTSGGIKPDLTHPFLITAKSPLLLKWVGEASLLFHNGICSTWEDKLLSFYLGHKLKMPEGSWNDTRFAAVVAHHLGENALSFLSGKFAVQRPAGKIRLYGDFYEESGVYFSNTSYRFKAVTPSASTKWMSVWEGNEGARMSCQGNREHYP